MQWKKSLRYCGDRLAKRDSPLAACSLVRGTPPRATLPETRPWAVVGLTCAAFATLVHIIRRAATSATMLARKQRLLKTLAQIEALISEEKGADAVAASGGGGSTPVLTSSQVAADTADPTTTTTAASATNVVTIGTSSDCISDPTLPRRISSLVNAAYTHSLGSIIPDGETYERTSPRDIRDRLRMGDAGVQANRVLHIARQRRAVGGDGEGEGEDELVGCCSSTFQPPWSFNCRLVYLAICKAI